MSLPVQHIILNIEKLVFTDHIPLGWTTRAMTIAWQLRQHLQDLLRN
jgi:hypothetical protein